MLTHNRKMPEQLTLCRHMPRTIHASNWHVYRVVGGTVPGSRRRRGRRACVCAHCSTSPRRHSLGRSARTGAGNVPCCDSFHAEPESAQPSSSATSFPESSSSAGSPVIGTVCLGDSTPTSTSHGASSLHTHNGVCRCCPTLATGWGMSGYRFNHVNTFAVIVSTRTATWAADTSSSASTQRPITHDHPPPPPPASANADPLASRRDARARHHGARYCPVSRTRRATPCVNATGRPTPDTIRRTNNNN